MLADPPSVHVSLKALIYILWSSSIRIIIFFFIIIMVSQGDREKTNALKDLLSRIDLDELMKKDEPPLTFPSTLEEFEYAFNENPTSCSGGLCQPSQKASVLKVSRRAGRSRWERGLRDREEAGDPEQEGELRHIKTREAFVFNAREDLHRWNQKRYEALGEIITRYVYELLEKECNLTKKTVPVDATADEASSFVYLSADALSNPAKLLVLIQGYGVVRAGQWARRLIINQDLDSGTQIPFITRAALEGYGVLVLNPNENHLEVEKPGDTSPPPPPPPASSSASSTSASTSAPAAPEPSDEPEEKQERKEGKRKRESYEKYRNPQREKETEQIPIRENSSPEEHVQYAWDHFVSKAAAKNVFIVAHSYGGLAFVELMKQREAQVKQRVCAVALTDSAHNIWLQKSSKSMQEWMQECCRNWVSSPQPLDSPVDAMLPDCPRVSAGTEKHELTSWSSFDSIFRFFDEALLAAEEEEEEEKKEKEKEEVESSKIVTTRSSALKNRHHHQDL